MAHKTTKLRKSIKNISILFEDEKSIDMKSSKYSKDFIDERLITMSAY